MKEITKKAVASVLSILCITTSVTCMPLYADTYYGDANSDNHVDENDVILLQEYFTGQTETTPDLFAADMDDDDDTDIWDIMFLKRWLVYGVMPGEKPGEEIIDPTESTEPTDEPVDEDEQARAYAMEVVELVNEERAAMGLSPVVFNEDLFEAAMIRAYELPELFSHTRPDGTKWSNLLDEIGYGNRWRAENIAGGNSTPEATVEQWMNSDGHRANILGENYTQLGVGFVYDPDSDYRYYWVQLFTS